MRVKFTADYQYETDGRNAGPEFKAGDIKEFRDDIAERFIRRGVAEELTGAAARTTPQAATAKATEPTKAEPKAADVKAPEPKTDKPQAGGGKA